MKKILIVVLAMLFLQCSEAQTYLNNKDELSQHSEKVLKLLTSSEFQKAFIELRKHWPLPENEMVQLESQTIKQFNIVADRFGKIIDFDFITDKSIKNYAIKKVYVIRFDKHMIKVLFTYYRNNDGWMLNGFEWNDQIEELFE